MTMQKVKTPKFSFIKLYLYEMYESINLMFKDKNKFLKEDLKEEDLKRIYNICKDFIKYSDEDKLTKKEIIKKILEE
jgi:hypothetical protein